MAYNFILETGAIIADTSLALAETQADYQAVFGGDLDLTPSSPQGLLITADTLVKDAVARNNADISNQFNPNLAGGIFLDAICAMTGLSRLPATKSVVQVVITGTSGTIISAGFLAETAAVDRFELITAVTIPPTGTVTATFQAVEFGIVPCAAGALNIITNGQLGVTSLTNPAAATLGTNQQSDLSLLSLRRRTLALQGVQTAEAVTSALYKIYGVQSLAFRENVESAMQVIDTISMMPHSIYVCVNGGTDAEVAQAILESRSAGSGFNGLITYPITTASGQVLNVKFSRPEVINVLIKITARITGGASSAAIIQRVLDYANGMVAGEDGFVVGGSVSPFELSGAAMGIAGVYVTKCEIAPALTGVYVTSEIPILISQIAATTQSSITVVIS